MRSFLGLVKKEYLQLFRDWVVLAFMVYLFVPDVIIAGKGLGIRLRNARFAVWDMSRTPASRELIAKMRSPFFLFEKELPSWKELDDWIKEGDTVGVLVIPPEFGKHLAEGKRATVMLVLDGSLISSATLSAAYAASILSDYNLWILRKRYHLTQKIQIPKVDAKIRVQYNPNLKSQFFGGLSELFTNVTMITIILAALVFVREKDYGTLEQVMVSPVSFVRVAAAKIAFISSCLLGFIFVSLIVAVRMVLGIPIQGNVLLFMLLSLLVVLANAGIGLIIAGLSERISQVGLFTILFLAPMLFLSGGWVPPESMPRWLLPLTGFSPLKYYLDLGLSIVLKGAGIQDIWPDLVKCAVLSAAMLFLGYFILKRRLERRG